MNASATGPEACPLTGTQASAGGALGRVCILDKWRSQGERGKGSEPRDCSHLSREEERKQPQTGDPALTRPAFFREGFY